MRQFMEWYQVSPGLALELCGVSGRPAYHLRQAWEDLSNLGSVIRVVRAPRCQSHGMKEVSLFFR